MMFNGPSFGMPYFNRYSRYGYRYPYNTYFGHENSYATKSNHTSYTGKKKENSNNVESNIKDNFSYNEMNMPLFELFGVKLFFDDVLLICLIWFLYEEGVRDEGLFAVLILLLMS